MLNTTLVCRLLVQCAVECTGVCHSTRTYMHMHIYTVYAACTVYEWMVHSSTTFSVQAIKKKILWAVKRATSEHFWLHWLFWNSFQTKRNFLTGYDVEKTINISCWKEKKVLNFFHSNHGFVCVSGVTANSLHPGVVMTDIMRNYNFIIRFLFNLVGFFFFKTAEEGAFSPIYCAVSEEVEGITGKYFDSDCSLVLPAPSARDPALGMKEYEFCERLTAKP